MATISHDAIFLSSWPSAKFFFSDTFLSTIPHPNFFNDKISPSPRSNQLKSVSLLHKVTLYFRYSFVAIMMTGLKFTSLTQSLSLSLIYKFIDSFSILSFFPFWQQLKSFRKIIQQNDSLFFETLDMCLKINIQLAKQPFGLRHYLLLSRLNYKTFKKLFLACSIQKMFFVYRV